MQDKIQKQILDAFFVVLRPIAKILLRYGIGYREFAEVAKSAFVDVASSEYGIRGRPTNMSRIAVMTGLTRKEVRRQRNKLEKNEHAVVSRTTPMWEVLHHWYAEDEFIGADGSPKPLPFQGDVGSFSSLVRRFGGDIPAGAMRAELKRVGAILEQDGMLLAQKRSFRPDDDVETLRNSLIHAVYALLSTVSHNTNPGRTDRTWSQRVAYTQHVRNGDLPKLKRVTFDRIHEFTQALDDTFMSFETMNSLDERKESEGKSTVAVGVFYFEEDNRRMRHRW